MIRLQLNTLFVAYEFLTAFYRRRPICAGVLIAITGSRHQYTYVRLGLSASCPEISLSSCMGIRMFTLIG